MGLIRLFLLINGLIWVTYAISVAIKPEIFAQLVGLSLDSVMQVEVVAMYGGLQLALGIFSLLAVLMTSLVYPNLILWSLILPLLSGFRFVALWAAGDLFTLNFGEWGPGGYNEGALWFFELPFALISITLLIKFKGLSRNKRRTRLNSLHLAPRF